MDAPNWTVLYNIPGDYVGTGWEFFHEEKDGKAAYDKHRKLGNVPTLRPYFESVDREHMGAAHQVGYGRNSKEVY